MSLKRTSNSDSSRVASSSISDSVSDSSLELLSEPRSPNPALMLYGGRCPVTIEEPTEISNGKVFQYESYSAEDLYEAHLVW